MALRTILMHAAPDEDDDRLCDSPLEGVPFGIL